MVNTDFLKDLGIYFRDYLDTDFKKQRKPKRKIIRKDGENRLTAISLNRYPGFVNDIWKVLDEPVGTGFTLEIRRNRYTVPLDSRLVDFISKQIQSISTENLEKLIDLITSRPKQELTGKEFEHADKIVQATMTLIERETKRELVVPLLKGLDAHIEEQSIKGLEDIFDTEQELVELFLAPADEALSSSINTALVEKDFSEYESLIRDIFDEKTVKQRLLDYFESFSSADLFNELLDIKNTIKQKENFQVYLYISDISFEGSKYPLVTVPLELTHLEQKISLEGSPHIYLNKKAIDYVSEQLAQQQGQRVASIVKDRILYLMPEDSITKIVQQLLDTWSHDLNIRPPLDLNVKRPQQSKSSETTTTNNLTIAAYEKSDESLLNDYERLIELVDADHPIINDFATIVGKFLYEEPASFLDQVETSWEKTAMVERLVFESPVPLNSEQRKIINALHENNCRFIAVQGPPGTGKSHTITAIAFESILKGQSVLILSDKTEALDVVEDKLTSTLNQVRVDESFQNPILRLGRSSNTYSKILTGASINRIQQNYLVARKNKKEFEQELETKQSRLKETLSVCKEKAEVIDILEVAKFERIEKKASGRYPTLTRYEQIEQIAKGLQTIRSFAELLAKQDHEFLASLKYGKLKLGLKNFDGVIDLQSVVKQCSKEEQFVGIVYKYFNSFSFSQVDQLREFSYDYWKLKNPVFGFLFCRKQARELDREFEKFFDCKPVKDIHKHLDDLDYAYQELKSISSPLETLNLKPFFNVAFLQLKNKFVMSNPDQKAARILLDKTRLFFDQHEDVCREIGFTKKSLSDWLFNLDETPNLKFISDYVNRKALLSRQFKELPDIDYKGDKTELESLQTKKLANTIDERVVNFYENHRTLAQSIKTIIRKKQQFPCDKFEHIKEAFPCIIANIRDYAEYVPLERELFDIVIIDEASQVSVAQAFPAIIRSKKTLVLGDKHQFSNVKTSQASIAINSTYLNDIRGRFLGFDHETPLDADVLTRLGLFNIKTSILSFAESLANYTTMLRKHFRGYPELIGFSSDYFYERQLQTVKLRGKSIDDVLEFTFVEDDGKDSVRGNANELEADAIEEELLSLLEEEEPPSVAIITPFQDQLAYLSKRLGKHESAQEFEKLLKLKIMTFDSCQGEERDIVMYSMVANLRRDRLWSIFPKSIKEAGDIEEVLRLQRLNVGFSRAKEKIHFFLSKEISDFEGAIGEAIRYYDKVLAKSRELPEVDQVDPKSPMEARLLGWLRESSFFEKYEGCFELIPQFPVGDYLRQLDQNYQHPAYKVDFLLKLRIGNSDNNIIIEYDGFTEHFRDLENVTAENYREYYKADDIEREKTLESYGYHMLRVNRFNLGLDPIKTISDRLDKLVKRISSIDSSMNPLLERMNTMQEDLAKGEMKLCPKCKELRKIADFLTPDTKSGRARHCVQCRPVKTKRRSSRRRRHDWRSIRYW